MLLSTFKVHGLALHHLTELPIPYVPGLDMALLVVCKSRLVTWSNRAIAINGLTLWMSLPEDLWLNKKNTS